MKSFTSFSIIAFSVFILMSCGSDNFETFEEIELPNDPTIIEIENPLAFSSARSATYLQEGIAYQTKNGENSLFSIASEAVEVECPGSATSYMGGGVFFLFQFVVTPENSFTFNGRMNVEIDGKLKSAFYWPQPECENTSMLSTEYEIKDDRIVGTINGEYHYLADELVEPFESCENFIGTGELTVNFDLPLIVCN